MTHWTDTLPRGACVDAVAWCRTQPDLATAWNACERGDWMLWLIGKYAGAPWSDTRRPLVACCAEIAELVLPHYEARYPGDRRVRDCIDTARRWSRGEATSDELDAAADAAAYADHAAADAAAYAAHAARAARAAYAAYAAAYAAYAAAYAATNQQVAASIRKHYPTPPEAKP